MAIMGKLDKEYGRNLNWLFELRSVGDYGVVIHVTAEDARQAVEIANEFLVAVQNILQK